MQHAGVVVEARAAASRRRPCRVLVPAEAGHDAVGGAHVLDLQHRALAGLVGASTRASRSRRRARRLRTAASQSLGLGAIARHRRQVQRRLRARRAAARAARAARPAAVPSSTRRRRRAGRRRRSDAGVSFASFATRDAAGWSRSCSASKSSPRGVAITISPSSTQPVGQRLVQRLSQLGEVAVQRLQVAALDVDVCSPPRKTIARKPSHFGSKRKPRSPGTRRRSWRASARSAAREGGQKACGGGGEAADETGVSHRGPALNLPAEIRGPHCGKYFANSLSSPFGSLAIALLIQPGMSPT